MLSEWRMKAPIVFQFCRGCQELSFLGAGAKCGISGLWCVWIYLPLDRDLWKRFNIQFFCWGKLTSTNWMRECGMKDIWLRCRCETEYERYLYDAKAFNYECQPSEDLRLAYFFNGIWSLWGRFPFTREVWNSVRESPEIQVTWICMVGWDFSSIRDIFRPYLNNEG